jgi:hypothetical protein
MVRIWGLAVSDRPYLTPYLLCDICNKHTPHTFYKHHVTASLED